MKAWKWKAPKRSSFMHHCGQCKWWTFYREIGAAVEGICQVVEPSIEDAYGSPCALWEKRRK